MSTPSTRRRLPTWLIVIALALLALFVLQAAPVGADASYHTERVEFMAAAGEPLRSGFVTNIHPDGPNVYAHEIYVLNGAQPDSTYEVLLIGYVAQPQCAGTPITIPTAELNTNPAGNGKAEFVFSPSDIPDEWRLPNPNVHGVRWEVRLDGALVYETGCISVTLD